MNVLKATDLIEKSSNSPCMLTFQNGKFLGKREGAKITADVSVDGESKKRTIKVDIEGQKYEGKEKQSPYLRKFMLIRKAGTGKIRMVEFGEASMVHSALLTRHSKVQTAGDDYNSRNAALNKMFGGKKGVRRMERSEKLRLNASANEESLLATVRAMEVMKAAKSTTNLVEASMADVLPPCHRDASSVQQVYVLSELLGQDVIDALESDAVYNLDHANDLCWFAESLRRSLQGKKDPETAIAIFFVDALVKCIRTKVSKLKSTPLSDAPVIHQRIIDTFCCKTGRVLTRSNALKDKAIAYCIAIGFVLSNYTLRLDDLCQDISLSERRLGPICQAVGGTKVHRSQAYVLKLPLPPLPKAAPSKKRKR